MTANTWPAPARPGVPLNPEKDGWHWVQHGNGAIVPRFWRCDHWEGVGHSGITPIEPSEAAIAWTYLGPILTPDEATALQKRCEEAERERAHQHGRADRNAAEHAREQAKREALQARVAELEGALQRIASAGGLFAEPASGQHAREIARAALGGKDE